jgi:hypothetical protein
MTTVARAALGGALAVTGLSLAGCGGGKGAAASGAPTPTPETAAPIDTAGLPQIRFARGTTSGILDDSLPAGATRSYVLSAEQGQVMLVHAIAWPVAERQNPPPEPEVRVFAAAAGRELPSPRAEPEVWSARLPVTGEYVVRVTAAAPTAYTLAVQIPRRAEVSAAEPVAIFTGSTPSRVPIDYLIHADAGRTLEITLGGAPTVGLHVYGLDDGVQLAALADKQRLYAGRVETTQDYVVSVVPGEERAAYDLRITVR